MACTNSVIADKKCFEEATCIYCAFHGLKCIYAKSVKKRGPKMTNRSANIFENNF
ncbi:43_t:CDS:1, partial [Dentiscutata erythropus]